MCFLSMIAIATGPRFSLGTLVITANALGKLASEDVRAALRRHGHGDWEELGAHDRAQNKRALEFGDRLFSAYTTPSGTRSYVITESDRSVTTILLPEDY
jgi:hypothetical protein